MAEYSVADAKNSLPKLIYRALAGEEVVITRRGKPVAQLRPSAAAPSPPTVSNKRLFERTRARPAVDITSVELLDLLNEVDQDEHLFRRQLGSSDPGPVTRYRHRGDFI